MLGDGIELVVVAARAGGGDTEKGLRHGVDLLIGEIEGELARIGFVDALGSQRQKPGGDELFGALRVIFRGQQIARQLLAQELVIGLVLVERLDDVVAIPPGVRKGEVDVLARALRVACHVQPVTAKAFAEMRGVEQPVHHLLEGIG